MCKWNKWGDTRIDPCMRNIIYYLKRQGIETVSCCCGHGKYPPTIVVHHGLHLKEIYSGIIFDIRRKIYKRDKQGVYYIPEVLEDLRKLRAPKSLRDYILGS